MKDSGPVVEVGESGNADLREEVSFGGLQFGAVLDEAGSLERLAFKSNAVVGWSVLPHPQGCTSAIGGLVPTPMPRFFKVSWRLSVHTQHSTNS